MAKSNSAKTIEDVIRSINYFTDQNMKLPKWLQKEMESCAQEEMFFGFGDRFTEASLQGFFNLAQKSKVKINAQYVYLSTQDTLTNYNSVENLLMADPQAQNDFLARANSAARNITDPLLRAQTYCNMAAIHHSRGDELSQSKAFDCYQNAIFSLPARNSSEAKTIVNAMKSLDQIELRDAQGKKMDPKQYFESVNNYFNRQNLFGASTVKETAQNINEGRFEDSYLAKENNKLLSRGRAAPSTSPSSVNASALRSIQPLSRS